MRIIYAGTPEYAVRPLERLLDEGRDVAAVLCSPDRPAGRGGTVTPPPVKTAALSRGVPVMQYAKVRDHVAEIRGLGADAMITCAFGQILTDELIKAFPKGVWNLHASLLPKFRGASPIQSAILAGEEHTGVTVMRTELELDAGDILLVKRCEVGKKTYGELSDELSALSADAVSEAFGLIESGDRQLLLQNKREATFCRKIGRDDARLDFTAAAEETCRKVRAMNPEPVAWCMLGGKALNVYEAEPADAEGLGAGEPGEVAAADRRSGIVVRCSGGAVRILSAQLPGGKRLSWRDLVNGRRISAGDRLE